MVKLYGDNPGVSFSAVCTQYIIYHFFRCAGKCGLQLIYCVWICENKVSREKYPVFTRAGNNDGTWIRYNDSSVYSVYQAWVGSYLHAVNRSVLFRKCVQYISYETVLYVH